MQLIDQTFGTAIRVIKTKTRIILSVMLVSAILLAWLGLSAPSQVPQAAAASTTLYTSLVVQNMDLYSTMNAKLTYYNSSGQTVLSTAHTLAPFRSLTIDQPSQWGLPLDYVGASMLESDTPFGVIVKQYAGTASTLGKDFRMESYNGWPSIAIATDIALPQLLKNIYDPGANATYNSRIVVQNTSTASASVTIKYTKSATEEYVHSGIAIAAGGSYTIDIQNDSALSSLTSFYGSGRVTSTLPVAVVVQQNATGILLAYSGFSSANSAMTLYLSQLLKAVNDPGSGYTWGSGVQVMSMDGTSANVTITYESSTGATYTESQTAAPFATFDQRYSTALPSSFYGTGKLTADKPIVAIVNIVTNYDANRGMRAASYRAFPSTAGAARVFLPILRKNALDAVTGIRQSTGVVGRLIGSSATTVTLTYYFTDGTSLQRTQTVSPSAPMINFDQRNDAALADGSVASGVLTTSPAQPIVAAVAIAVDSTVLGDASMYYEGISQ